MDFVNGHTRQKRTIENEPPRKITRCKNAKTVRPQHIYKTLLRTRQMEHVTLEGISLRYPSTGLTVPSMLEIILYKQIPECVPSGGTQVTHSLKRYSFVLAGPC